MITLRQIREMLSEAYAETTFYARTNETHFPARWTMGDGAGDASTGCRYDRRLQQASEHIARSLGLAMDCEFDNETRQRDCADLIAGALRKQAESDAKTDDTLDVPIPERA